MNPLAQRIDAVLPQTQCTRCGYAACRPYAEALAKGEAALDRCPPGGEDGIAKLAAILEVPVRPLAGEVGPAVSPRVAVIDEATCIGCTKCIQACPVDAIVGANRLMHTVIASWCTGCELCLPPCPVDCIRMDDAAALPPADLSRERHAGRAARLERLERECERRLAAWE